MRQGMTLFFALFVALGLGLTSCGEESIIGSPMVTGDQVYGDYQITYDEEEDMTYMQATFTLGNQQVKNAKKVKAGSVNFDGAELMWSDESAAYMRKVPGMVSKGVFTYTDMTGSKFQNEAIVYPSSYPSNFEGMTYSSDSEFVWEGEALENSGKVSLSVTKDEEGLSPVVFETDEEGATFIEISSQVVKTIQEGKMNATLTRMNQRDLQEVGGGRLTTKYIATTKEISISE